jgi:hypothetical protein
LNTGGLNLTAARVPRDDLDAERLVVRVPLSELFEFDLGLPRGSISCFLAGSHSNAALPQPGPKSQGRKESEQQRHKNDPDRAHRKAGPR